MYIEVTQRHIEYGHVSVDQCPIALAIKDKLPNGSTVEVFTLLRLPPKRGRDLFVNIDGAKVELPKEAYNFVKCFDRGGTAKPFTFELDEV